MNPTNRSVNRMPETPTRRPVPYVRTAARKAATAAVKARHAAGFGHRGHTTRNPVSRWVDLPRGDAWEAYVKTLASHTPTSQEMPL